MAVIPITRGRRRANRTLTPTLNRSAQTHGTFRAPSGRQGAMTGSMRLDRLVLASGRLRAIAVFTGELVDADGSRVGVGSRRAVAPADIVRSANGMSLSIGPLDVDLLGLVVSVEAFTVEMRTAEHVKDGEPDRGLASIAT